MPANKNSLIRYKTIDRCLQNCDKQWTLEDLIDACSNVLSKSEGTTGKGISKRTIQMDIQVMRSKDLGYEAPIVVYENKYYTYEDKNYSITKTPLNSEDLKMLSEAVEILQQFNDFSYFSNMSEIVTNLEDRVAAISQQTTPNCIADATESEKILFEVYSKQAANIMAKPIHNSQKLIEESKDGSLIFEIDTVITPALQRTFFGYADGLKVLKPKSLAKTLHKGLKQAAKNYKD